jgi:hypothetical protein
VVTATESRSRHLNLRQAMTRLEAKLAARNRVVIPRVPTRPGKAAIERRLEQKHRQAARKQSRSHSQE